MAVNRLIRNFVFDEKVRQDLVFSDITKIRLNTEDQSLTKIQLKKDSAGDFSLDPNIFIETALITPQALQKWLKFELIVTEEIGTFSLPAGTSVGLKVKTTAGNRYWNGSSWAVAGLSNWNTESEINANIDSFPIASIGNKGIGFVVNLVTTDPKVSPEVQELKLAGQFDIEFLDDLVYDSLIRKLNTTFRSSSVLRFPSTGSISSIDLNTVLENKGYNITGIRSVYNLTDDPLKLANLFDSYTPGALKRDGFTNKPGTVNFTGAIADSKLIDIQFEYVPEIYIRAGQDFFEVPAFPSIIFENILDIEDQFTARDTNDIGEDFVRDKANLTAIVQRAPRQQTMRFEYAIFTDRQLDQMRLINDINKFWSNNKSVSSFGLDIEYKVKVVQQTATARNEKTVDDTDTNVATGSFDILGVLFYDKPSEDVPLIGQGQVNADFDLQD